MQQRAIKQMIIPSQVWSVLKGDILYLTLCFVLNLKLLLKKVKSFFFFFKGDIQGAMEVYDLGT